MALWVPWSGAGGKNSQPVAGGGGGGGRQFSPSLPAPSPPGQWEQPSTSLTSNPNPSRDRHLGVIALWTAPLLPPGNLAATALPEAGFRALDSRTGHTLKPSGVAIPGSPAPAHPVRLPPTPGSPSAQDHPQKPSTRQLCPPAANWLPLCPRLLLTAGASGTVTAVPAAPGQEAPRRTAPCPHLPAPQGSSGRARRRPGSPLTSVALSPHQRHCSVGTVPRSQFSAETKRWGRERGAAGEGEGE